MRTVSRDATKKPKKKWMFLTQNSQVHKEENRQKMYQLDSEKFVL